MESGARAARAQRTGFFLVFPLISSVREDVLLELEEPPPAAAPAAESLSDYVNRVGGLVLGGGGKEGG